MVVEAVVLTPLGWLASPLFKTLFDKAHHHLGTGIDEKMKILEATVLPRLSLAIEKAKKSPNKEKLVDWLNRLKGAYYEAEEAIDLLEYEKLKQKVKDDKKTLEQKDKNERGTPINWPSQFVPRRLKIASIKLKDGLSVFSWQKIMLKDCINKLIEIAKEADEFRDLLEVQENACGSDAHRETNSEPPARVFGRDVDKENVVSLLSKKCFGSQKGKLPDIGIAVTFEPGPSTRQAIPVIAITGRSGVGKTALAQYVYNDMDEQQYFDLLIWVHTARKFKATDVIKDMIEIMNAKECARNDNPSTNLEALLTQTKRMLGSKKVLLVLDDFWSDSGDFLEQWENFIGCLSSCSPESRILLTTQSQNVAGKAIIAGVTNVETYYLREIEEGQFLELFMHHAFPNNCHLQKEEFEKIGRKIVVKLKGDPGAAKLVGRQLSERLDLKYWEEVAEKDWFGDNMKARLWSYQQLPLDLQRCFAICSLFPKGCELSGPFLIELWMAEGFIRPIDNQDRLEDIGENYLHELVSRFFLEPAVAMDETIIYYQLHDLLLDLAERVQGDDFIKIVPTSSREHSSQISHMLFRSENIRHILLPSSKIEELKQILCMMKNICTFFVEPDGDFVPKKVLEEILKHFKRLRVLCLPRCIDEMPYCIGNLKHLRLLKIHGSPPLKELPDSMCKLYHLQTLALPNCVALPKDFSKLISLRHFQTGKETMSKISHVGRLSSLKGLDQFVVRKKCGYELHQLENLNQLRGKLCITGLEHVGSTADAKNANMGNKKHLEELAFEWNSNKRGTNNATGLSTQHVQLLDALQPHPNISVLTLKGFGGDRFPDWLQNRNSLKHLMSLTLMDCDKVKEISSIDESLPNCGRLVLQGLKNLRKIPSLPSNLTYLVIDQIPQLSFFSEADLLMKKEINHSKLEVVKQIAECVRLNCIELSQKFRSPVKKILEYLQLNENVLSAVRPFLQFAKERLEIAQEICITSSQYENIFLGILKFAPFSDAYFQDQILDVWVMCMHCRLETMFNKNEESKLVLPSSLTYLEISSCSITDDALSTCIQCLVSLSKLKLSDVQTITTLPPKEVLFSLKNLQSLTIEECYLLNSLGGIGALTSLIALELNGCLNLNPSNEPLPSSLESVKFCDSSNVDAIINKSNLPVLHSLYIQDITFNWSGVLHVGHLSCLKMLFIGGIDGCLVGLNSLTALYGLWVTRCPVMKPLSPKDQYTSALQQVSFDNLLQLKLILSKESISSIDTLVICFFQGDSSDDEVFQSLTSLKHLFFQDCKITHLPKNLKNLATLQYMELENCPNLCELEELPRNLRELKITDCPISLMEKFNKDGLYQVWIQERSITVTFPTEEERNRF
ncbi:putative disease resistance protein RGA1 [Carex rostrata]